MPNIYAYPGEGVPTNIKLRDPTVLAPSGSTITMDSDVTLAVNSRREWVIEETGSVWVEEVTGQPVYEELDLDLAVFNISAAVAAQTPWHFFIRVAA